MPTKTSYALKVANYLTGSGIPGVKRPAGSARIHVPGWNLYVSGPRILPHRMSMGELLGELDEQIGHPVVVRYVNDEVELAQVTMRLEDFGPLVATGLGGRR